MADTAAPRVIVIPRTTDSPEEISTVYLGLGGNMDDRLVHLQGAFSELSQHPELQVRSFSRLYESQYVGPGQQQSYLNACVEIRTTLEPQALLTVLKEMERSHGRTANGHMKPRPLDLDILMFGNRMSQDPELILPHPRLREREFVMEPLAEIAADEIFPDSCETVACVCAKIRRKSGSWIRVRDDISLRP